MRNRRRSALISFDKLSNGGRCCGTDHQLNCNMWNRNSREWLVKDKSGVVNLDAHSLSVDPQRIPAFDQSNTAPARCQHQYNYQQQQQQQQQKQQQQQRRQPSQPPATCSKRAPYSAHASRRSRSLRPNDRVSSSRSRIHSSSSSSPCLNQILEVLLVILVANCLVHPVLAVSEAAFPWSNPPHHKYARANGESDAPAVDLNYANNIDDLQTASGVLYLHRSQNFKISPKPCSIGRIEGTCMFVWECIKSEGRHVGMCVDSFMFGSCCAHNYTDNIVLPQTFSYTRPTKPVGISSLNHRPRPPHTPHKPSISGMTTIERPHGAGTLVIRPSGPHHQGALHRPSKAPTTSSTSSSSTTSMNDDRNPPWSSNVIGSNDLQVAESIAPASFSPSNLVASSGHTVAHQHWQMTTQPNFVTKTRPPSYEKPTTTFLPKPSKPTKKPTASSSFHQHTHHQLTAQQTPPPASSIVYSTRRPTPLPIFMPTKYKPQPQPQPPQSQFQTQTQFHNQMKPSTLAPVSHAPSRPTTPYWTPPSYNSTRPVSSSTTTPYRPTTTTPSTTHHWSSSSTHRPTSTSPATQSSLQPLDPTTIESNEIPDSQSSSADGIATIKTISAARTAECGQPLLARPETRIVGGKSAAFGRWPWQVSVRRTSFFGFSSTHRCGGALINENWIATAGHCVDDLLTSQIRIRVGEYDFSHVQEQLPYIERAVAKKVVHPQYNYFTYEYDLALVQLEQSLEFAPHVSPICLPQTDSLLIGMNATVTGWGRLSEGGTLPSVLQEVAVPIVSNDNCKSMFLRAGRQEFIPDIFLCAGYETGGQDSCQGDSGGPLQVKSQDGRFFLAGIISWGIGCAEANLPGVCTRISKFVPWILEHVTKSEPE